MKIVLHTVFYFMFLLFGCTADDDVDYRKRSLIMVVKFSNGQIDTLQKDFENEYSLITHSSKSGDPSYEFFEDGLSIEKLKVQNSYPAYSFTAGPRRRMTKWTGVDAEKKITVLEIDTNIATIYEENRYVKAQILKGYYLVEDFPFEGINCFKYED
jgi:hypothetical protein